MEPRGKVGLHDEKSWHVTAQEHSDGAMRVGRSADADAAAMLDAHVDVLAQNRLHELDIAVATSMLTTTIERIATVQRNVGQPADTWSVNAITTITPRSDYDLT